MHDAPSLPKQMEWMRCFRPAMKLLPCGKVTVAAVEVLAVQQYSMPPLQSPAIYTCPELQPHRLRLHLQALTTHLPRQASNLPEP